MYFQQLRRELDRCKRRDQLPAGCVHKQLFHHLRNRLSEFGRRKCGQLQRDRVKSEDDYRVRAYNGCATSANSSVKSVKTSCTPVAPTAQSATNVTASSFTANWSSVSGATDYRLDVSTSSSFTTYVPGYQNLDVGNVTSSPVTGLSANTTYYYRVRAYNDCATSSNSNVTSVQTSSG